jgi:hypothetical protein
MNAGDQNRTSAMAAQKSQQMKPETHVDLEEMRSDVTNCHPHPIGIGREQQKSSREAEVDLDQRP